MEVGGFFMLLWLATCRNAKEIIQKILISLLTTLGKKALRVHDVVEGWIEKQLVTGQFNKISVYVHL